jgi:hypothetical protein
MTPYEIEQISACISDTYPTARIEITPPLDGDGIWHVDAENLGPVQPVMVVQWSAATGFMMTRDRDTKGYGELSDEAFKSIDDARAWITRQRIGKE